MEKNTSIALWVLIVILGILIFGYLSSLGVFSKISKTGQAQQYKSETEARIATWFSITLSQNLSYPGIEFNITSLPTNADPGANATLNYNVTGETSYFILNEPSSNTPVHICIRANDTLKEEGGLNFIGIANYTWSQSYTNDWTNPTLVFTRFFNSSENSNDVWADGTPFASPLSIGSFSYHRFWLNVSNAQAAGTYRTYVQFKALDDSYDCTP